MLTYRGVARSLAVLTVMSWLGLKILGAEDSGAELLSVLQARDKAQLTPNTGHGFTVSFRMSMPANLTDPRQGIVDVDCVLTWTAALRAIKIQHNYRRPPVFVPKQAGASASGYDANGNYIVSRQLDKYALCDQDRNDAIIRYGKQRVSPEGKVFTDDDYTILFSYPINRPDNCIHEWYKFRMATGRGFAEHLDGITAVTPEISGKQNADAVGDFGRTLPGTWRITTDRGADALVREATFVRDGRTEPTIWTTSSGTMTAAGLTIARHGTFNSGQHEWSFEVTDLREINNAHLLVEDIRDRLNAPLPPMRSETIDYRGGPGVRIKTRE